MAVYVNLAADFWFSRSCSSESERHVCVDVCPARIRVSIFQQPASHMELRSARIMNLHNSREMLVFHVPFRVNTGLAT